MKARTENRNTPHLKAGVWLWGLCVALAFSGCKPPADDEEGGKPGGPPGPGGGPPAASVFAVSTTAAVRGPIRDYLALSGDIVAGSSVDAYSDIAGKITRLYVAVGSRVSRGQRLAEVDPSKPGMEFLPGYATAPLSGTIVSLPAQVGMTISQAQPIARIAGGNALEIRLYVAERFISRIARHQSCEIALDAWPGELFRGSVSEISPVLDPGSRTMEIRVNVENPGSRLKAGMFAKVKLITSFKENIVKIPSGALIQRFGEEYVFVAAREGEATVSRKRVVKPGINIDGVLEITEGLQSEEEVIIRGQSLLTDGAKINVIDRTSLVE